MSRSRIASASVSSASGATGALSGVHIQGNLKVETGAVLNANRISVTGNVQVESAQLDESSGAATYVDALSANATALAEGMSGGAISCQPAL